MKFDDLIIAKVTPWRRTWPRLWRFFARDAMGIFAFAILLLLFAMPFSVWLLYLALPALACHIITIILQTIIRRERPKAPTDYQLFIRTFSFPSGHASTAFAFATLLAINIFAIPGLPEFSALVLAVVFGVLAGCIALSRVVVGVHYPSDVLAGAVMGVAFGALFILI